MTIKKAKISILLFFVNNLLQHLSLGHYSFLFKVKFTLQSKNIPDFVILKVRLNLKTNTGHFYMHRWCLPLVLISPGAHDPLWPSRLLGKLANFNFIRIIPWTLVVNAGVAVETLERAVFSGRVWKVPYMRESTWNAHVEPRSNSVPLVVWRLC